MLYVEGLGRCVVRSFEEELGVLYVEGQGALYVEELRWAGQPRRGAHLFCCPCATRVR